MFDTKGKGIWIFCLILFGISVIISILNEDYYYLAFSLSAIGFILSNVLLKEIKPQKNSVIIQFLLIIILFIIKVVDIENSFFLIIFSILIVVLYGYILIKQIIGN